MAVAHSILVMVYYMLLRNEPYQEAGADYFDKSRTVTRAGHVELAEGGENDIWMICKCNSNRPYCL
jgi:CDGSH-type Zn-finger protein